MAGQGFARYKAMLMERRGPLPMWAWLAIIVALLVITVWWRRNKAAATPAAASSDSLMNGGAPYVFNVPLSATPAVNVTVPANPTATVPTAPPGGGATTPAITPTEESVPGPQVSIYDWINSLNDRYPGLGLTWDKLWSLNPGANASGKYLAWRPGYPNATPYFNPNWSGRNPPLGIPPMRIR